ncbi:MAG: TRAP transporter small permease [Gammaproteobacteria bacterium]|nr:TRAP transporter small permease [Gammaproteobacteria bacterium]
MVLPVSNTFFARIDRGYHLIEAALNYVAAAFLFSLMLLACAEVFMRKVFNSPIHGQADLVEIMIPTMGFFGLAYCQRLAGHVRMELFIHRLKGRALWIFEFLGNLATILIVSVMIWGTWQNFLNAYQIGDTSMDAQLPVWPPKLIITVGFCLLLIRCLIAFVGYLRLIRYPDAEPIGVPISPTVEDLAQSEAEAARDAIKDEDEEVAR